MNPVNGPVLVVLLLALLVLGFTVGAQHRVIIRTRNTLRHSQSRCRVLRSKLTVAESFAAAKDRHPSGRGLRAVGGGGA